MQDKLRRIATASIQIQAQIALHIQEGLGSQSKVSQLRSLLARIGRNKDRLQAALTRAQDQKAIVGKRIDFDVLVYALTSFKNLQQIRFMRVADEVDRGWLRFLQSQPRIESQSRLLDLKIAWSQHATNIDTDLGPFGWDIAWEKHAKTFWRAILESNCQSVARVSSRFFEPNTYCECPIGTSSLLPHMMKLDCGLS